MYPTDTRIQTTLRRLHADSDRDMPRVALGFARSMGRGLTPHHMRDAYIAVGRDQGRWLMEQVLDQGAQNIVEFGASFGISAIWLGAGARQTGGRVTTTEIEPGKITTARHNIAEAGLSDTVTLLAGDVLETLADHPGPIDLLFFDAWSDRYDALLDLLTPRLADGARLIIDNANFAGTARFIEGLEARPGWTLQPAPSARVGVAVWRG